MFNGSGNTKATINTSDVIKQMIINNTNIISYNSANIGFAVAKLENVGTSNSISYTAFGDGCGIIEIGC